MEEWKDISGFEGIYQISNKGRVKSLSRYVNGRHGRRLLKEKIRAQRSDKYGYKAVNLYAGGIDKAFYVHRLVAAHFVSGSGSQVNHLNGIKSDNAYTNLEWCNQSQNLKHAYNMGLKKPPPNTRPGRLHSKYGGDIEAMNIATGEKIILSGRKNIEEEGFSQTSISNCLRGIQVSHRGYKFRRIP